MVGGGIWPVVHRELRAGARRPLNHWLRVAGGLAGVISLFIAAFNAPITSVGNRIFAELHRLMMFLILCVVPAITADCIARERREGTLGLLFMTPLRSWEIVIGKTAVQVLKALTLWIAVVPILSIPFLSGGVTWGQLADHLGEELCVGIFCLAAGILATSLTDKRAAAFALAFAFAAALVFGLTEEKGWDVLRLRPGTMAVTTTSSWRSPAVVVQPIGANGNVRYFYNVRPASRSTGGAVAATTGPAMAVTSFWPIGGRILFALIVLWGAIRFAGFCVEKSWKDKIPSLRAIKWKKFYETPIFRQRFDRKMRETLEWNPIAWLQQYSWKARLIKWGLCLPFTALLCMASEADTFQGISEREVPVIFILAAAYTYAGVNSFLQEKKTGALELILVTPLSVDQIIFGRVWGLWKQFFPSTAILAGCYYGLRLIWPHASNDYGSGAFRSEWFGFNDLVNYLLTDDSLHQFALILAFFALPFYSTLAALLFRNLVFAAGLTWIALVAAPMAGILVFLVLMLLDWPPNMGWIYLGALAGHAAFATMAFRNLRQRLTKREYAF